MAEDSTDQMMLDPNVLITSTDQEVTPIVTASNEDQSDIVSQAFTSVEQEDPSVQYVTMTPEEAAAAGVMEEDQGTFDQVITTSLQFDPANPNVLYTADGTLINRSDLSMEEQALVQAALQQHLAEQEAEQELAVIDQSNTADKQSIGGIESSSSNMIESVQTSDIGLSEELSKQSSVENEMLTTSNMTGIMTSNPVVSNVNLASPDTNASQIVQTLANNVRRQQEYAKAQSLLNQARSTEKPVLPAGYRYEEKIVIRQGQPHVMKMPVKSKPTPKKTPELPAALASLMPKVDIGKDGNQVIRIHQSQITPEQLKSLQENPNVRLVFRPPSSSRRGGSRPQPTTPYSGRRRGRPRKNPYQVARSSPEPPPLKSFEESPPTTTRYGRHTKLPYYTKDYLSTENGDLTDDFTERSTETYTQPYNYVSTRGRRGRPRGSGNRTADKPYRRTGTYSSRMEMIREQQLNNDDELEANQRLSIVPPKPTLSSVEQAISTRRRNRLKELMESCSKDEIMEVTLPHLARVFSLYEFLTMKVEKNKLSRVYFADIYKEYESIHKYLTNLTGTYKELLNEPTQTSYFEMKKDEVKPDTEQNDECNRDSEEKKDESIEDKKSNETITVKSKKLLYSLGLEADTFKDVMLELTEKKTTLDKENNQTSNDKCKITQMKNMKEVTDGGDASAIINSIPQVSIDEQATSLMNNVKPEHINIETSEAVSANVVVTDQSSLLVSNPLTAQGSTSVTATTDGLFTVDTVQTISTSEQTSTSEPMQVDSNEVTTTVEETTIEASETGATTIVPASSSGPQIIQIGTGEDRQFIEVPEGYSLIQTPNGLVMSQVGTTITQGDDGVIYVTNEDGTSTPLDSQKSFPLETVESLLSLDNQQ